MPRGSKPGSLIMDRPLLLMQVVIVGDLYNVAVPSDLAGLRAAKARQQYLILRVISTRICLMWGRGEQ